MSKDKLKTEEEFFNAIAIGYDPDSRDASIFKSNWKRVSKSYFQSLARDLPLNTASNCWFSAGGPAVSGDIHLQAIGRDKGFHLFGNLDHQQGHMWMTVRSIKALGDYTGGANITLSAASLKRELLLPILLRMIGA